MLGVSSYTPRPSATATLISLLSTALPDVATAGDVPGEDDGYGPQFVVVDRVGGTDIAQGYLAENMFAFGCYALSGPDAEGLAERVIAALKTAQFRAVGAVQLGKFTVIGGPHKFDDPKVIQRRRYQLTATFIMH